MSNVDINVDRRMDGRKIGRLYRTLLQAGATKKTHIVETEDNLWNFAPQNVLTLVLLNPAFANSVDPDQLASDLDLHCLSLYMNL